MPALKNVFKPIRLPSIQRNSQFIKKLFKWHSKFQIYSLQFFSNLVFFSLTFLKQKTRSQLPRNEHSAKFLSAHVIHQKHAKCSMLSYSSHQRLVLLKSRKISLKEGFKECFKASSTRGYSFPLCKTDVKKIRSIKSKKKFKLIVRQKNLTHCDLKRERPFILLSINKRN